MNVQQAHNLSDYDHWFRYWMPYKFIQVPRTEVGNKYKHVYLPLNRNYKPLGITDTISRRL